MVDAPVSSPANLFVLSRDTLVVRGPDRKTWLDGLLTCAVTQVSATVGGYGLLLTKQGKIVTDVFLADTGAELLLGVAPGRGPAVRELLDRYLVMEDAELDDGAEPRLTWVLAGAADALALVDARARAALVLARWHGHLAVTSEPLPAALDAAELLAEHGLGVFGVDFSERDNPHEASLDRTAVSWSKGCYLGQEVVCMQDMRGKVKRRLVALDGSAALLTGDSLPEVITPDGSVAGQVSSMHRTPGGARLLANISTSALESPGELRVRGEVVRMAFGSASNLS